MITQILAAALLLGICIFFHELGHFLIGKWVGVRPRVFSIGYGRGLFFRRKKGTIYQITAFPLGGYVQFYGDDITREHKKVKKGDFFSVGPWRRIALAFGGPLFSFLLGFIVIFILMILGWQPTSNEVRVTPQSQSYEAGLRTGDQIIKVNSTPINSFEKLSYEVALASEATIDVVVQRNESKLNLNLNIPQREQGSIRFLPGVRPAGRSFLVNNTEKQVANNEFLMTGDRFISADQKPIETVSDLQKIINIDGKKEVTLEVERIEDGLISPGSAKKLTLTAPLKITEYVIFKSPVDLQTGVIMDDIEIFESSNNFKRIFINGESFSDWDKFIERARFAAKSGARISVGPVDIQGKIEFARKRLIGISLSEGQDAAKASLPTDIGSMFARTWNQTVFLTQGTLLGLYRIIEGKLDFNKSVSGPVKIMAIAAKTVDYGWEHYWFLLAQITIVLGIMNLLPLPVLDGGHILFYLIEAFYKPLPANVIMKAMQFGMALMLTLGIYVIFLDVYDVFILRIFG
jgi:regulator of sigma E protease